MTDNELNPMIFNNFDMDGRILEVIGKPLEFFVKEEEEPNDDMYSAHGDFNIQLMEENLGQLESSIIEEVFFLWDSYACEDDSKMTKSGIKLKKSLLESLVEVK